MAMPSISTGNYFVIIRDNAMKDISYDFRNWISDSRQLSKLDKVRFKDEYYNFLANFKENYSGPASVYKNFSKFLMEGEYLTPQSDVDKVIEGLFLLSKNMPEFIFEMTEKATGSSTHYQYSSQSSPHYLPTTIWFNDGRCQVAKARIVIPKFDPEWKNAFALKKEAKLEVVTERPTPPTHTHMGSNRARAEITKHTGWDGD